MSKRSSHTRGSRLRITIFGLRVPLLRVPLLRVPLLRVLLEISRRLDVIVIPLLISGQSLQMIRRQEARGKGLGTKGWSLVAGCWGSDIRDWGVGSAELGFGSTKLSLVACRTKFGLSR
jgi:hypothetical protein